MITDLFAPSRVDRALQAARQQVELIGPHLRLRGAVEMRGFRRLSDFVSLQSGFVPLRDVIHLNKRGQPTADVFPRLSVRISELTLIAQRQVEPPEADGDEPAQEHHIEKVKRRIRSVTTGHLVEGTISLYQAVDLMTFLESSDPAFLPITDATVRWLSDRRLKGRFDFLLLNRAHAVAYSEAS